MAGPDHVSGVHPGLGSVLECDHRNENRDSRARSVHAQSRGKKCERGEPSAALEGINSEGGGPCVQRSADQRGGETDTATRNADEGVATGARGAEPWTAGIRDSAARREYASCVENRIVARRTAGGRSFDRRYA